MGASGGGGDTHVASSRMSMFRSTLIGGDSTWATGSVSGVRVVASTSTVEDEGDGETMIGDETTGGLTCSTHAFRINSLSELSCSNIIC